MAIGLKENAKFLKATEAHTEKAKSLKEARETLYEVLTTTRGSKIVDTIYEAGMMAEMLGRLDVGVDGNVIELASKSFVNLPFQDAISFFKSKRLTTRKTFDAMDSAQKHNAFSVAGLTRRYQAEKIHGFLGEAVDGKLTKKQFFDKVKGQYKKWGVTSKGDYHLDNVYRTNTLSAYSQGRYDQMKAVTQRRPYWRYTTAGDESVRPSHAAMSGKIYPHDHEIWAEWYPLNGYQCRCKVTDLSKDEMADQGWKPDSKAPKIKGKTVQPDKGWNTSPAATTKTKGVTDSVTKKARQLNLFRGPRLSDKSGKVYETVGDVRGVGKDAELIKLADKKAGLVDVKVKELIKEHPTFSIHLGDYAKAPKNTAFLEVPIFSQSDDKLTQLTKRLADDAKIKLQAHQTNILGRIGYGAVDTRVWNSQEMLFSKLPGLAIGFQLARSTESVARIVTPKTGDIQGIAAALLQTEKGAGQAIRRAWDIGNVILRGVDRAKGYQRAILNTRRMGKGYQVVLTKIRGLAGWKHETVLVNAKLRQLLQVGDL